MLVRPRSLRVSARIATFVLFASLAAGHARAGERDDAAVVNSVDKILATDVPKANFGDAKKKLRALIDRCKRNCSGTAVAHVYMALGLVAAQINDGEEARGSWNDAFSLDPNADIPRANVNPAVRQQFEDAKRAWASANNKVIEDPGKSEWVNKQAYELYRQALQATEGKSFADCIDKEKQTLTLEENMRARMNLAQCEERSSKIVDALRDNAKALESARKRNDVVISRAIGERIATLLPKLSHVKFERPVEVQELQVTFDDRPIPEGRLGESFTIDPGTHSVHSEGLLRGGRVSADETFEAKEGETAQVKIKLKPAALTKGQLECMVSAKTQEEILACVPRDRKPLVVHVGMEMSGYKDTTAVNILSPAIRGSVVSPTAGWNVGASYLLDVVTAASPDVVASASRHFRDYRHAVGVTGGYKPGRWGAQGSFSYSQEKDYISRAAGLTLTGDFKDKLVTPALGYSYTWDTIGRAGTDFSVYGKPFNTHEITAGSTIVINPTTVFVAGVGVALENGDQSKPYRYIPLFAPGVNPPIGASATQVNAERLPAKPLEQLPLDRQRYSISGRYISRIRSNATLRIEQRFYRDSWAVDASSTDARYLIDVSPRLRVWPHAHFHMQDGAKFYRRVYGGILQADGSAVIPDYRSSDRELSPMIGLTGGGGFRLGLTKPGSKVNYGLLVSGDALFNWYENSFYIRTRLAGYGTIGFEADFE